MATVNVIKVNNPLKPYEREISEVELISGQTLNSFIPTGDFVVSLNGEVIPAIYYPETYPQNGASIVIVPQIHGDDREILRTAAMIAITAGAMAAFGPGGAFAPQSTFWAWAAVGATVAAGGYLVNTILPPILPDAPQMEIEERETSYRWNNQTTQQQGIVNPKWYGKNKITGNIIAADVEIDYDKQYLNVLIGLGVGVFNSISDIKINDQNPDNLDNVDIYTRLGEINQEPVPNFNDTKLESPLSVKVEYGDQYVYDVPTTSFDMLEADITFTSGLYKVGDDGKLKNLTCRFIVEYKEIDSILWKTAEDVTITDKRAIALTKTVKSPQLDSSKEYQLRITRYTEDHTETNEHSDIYLTAVRRVFLDDFTYPRQALVGIKALATDQLSGCFQFSCLAECALVRVFDGSSWGVEYSENPAWICFDVLTQPVLDNSHNVIRYDGINPDRLDADAFKDWAGYCDELVPDGNGGTEPRCRFSGGFDSETSVWEAALKVCTAGRAMLVWNGLEITVTIDRPATPVQLFSSGNIIMNSFSGSYLPQTDRVDTLEIDFINADSDYERDKIRVVNALSSGSTNTASVNLFGVTRPTQVWREAMLRLEQNRHISRSVEFEADIDAIACTVGDVVQVQHDVPMWGDGGRVLAADSTSITLDKFVLMESGKSYQILIRLADDSLVQKDIVTASGETDMLTLQVPFADIPEKYAPYAFGETDKTSKAFRITEISRSGDMRRRISGVEYVEEIYNVDSLEPVVSSAESAEYTLPKVTSISVYERNATEADGTISTYLEIYWRRASGLVSDYEIYADSGTGFLFLAKTQDTYFKMPAEAGTDYAIKILAVTTAGLKPALETVSAESVHVFGATATVPDVVGIEAELVGGGVAINWDASTITDLSHYEIRYSTDQLSSWDNAIVKGIAKTTYFTIPAAVSGVYLVKAVNTRGQKSVNPASIVTDIPDITGLQLLREIQEPSTWEGTKTGFDVEFTSLVTGTDESGYLSSSEYECSELLELASNKPVRLVPEIIIGTRNSEDEFDNITVLDNVTCIDGEAGDVKTIVYISTSEDGITFADYKPFSAGDYRQKAFKFKIKSESFNTNHAAVIFSFKVKAYLAERFERGDDVSVGISGTEILFNKAYENKPSVAVTLQGSTPGDSYRLTGLTSSGFTVELFDITGTAKAGSIDWYSRGI